MAFTANFVFQQISQIFLVLASILHVSNLSFVSWEETGGVKIADEYTLHAVANLLSIDNKVELAEALISSVHFIRGMSSVHLLYIFSVSHLSRFSQKMSKVYGDCFVITASQLSRTYHCRKSQFKTGRTLKDTLGLLFKSVLESSLVSDVTLQS